LNKAPASDGKIEMPFFQVPLFVLTLFLRVEKAPLLSSLRADARYFFDSPRDRAACYLLRVLIQAPSYFSFPISEFNAATDAGSALPVGSPLT